MYQNLRDSVDSWLSQHHLLYQYHLPVSTSHQALIEMVITAMKSSPSQYQFPPPRDSHFAMHELLPLQPLGLVSRGIPRPNGQVHLRPLTMRPGAPLSSLITDRAIFAAKSCVEGNEWAIYLSNCHILIFLSSLLTLITIFYSLLLLANCLHSERVSTPVSHLLVSSPIFW